MNDYIIWFIAIFGLMAMAGVFWRMQRGFGPYNLRALGIVSVGTFATLLALKDSSSLTPAVGILGAMGGYLFGLKDKQ